MDLLTVTTTREVRCTVLYILRTRCSRSSDSTTVRSSGTRSRSLAVSRACASVNQASSSSTSAALPRAALSASCSRTARCSHRRTACCHLPRHTHNTSLFSFIRPLLTRHCSRLLPSAVLRRRCCRRPAPPLSIAISRPHVAQQQTRRTP